MTTESNESQATPARRPDPARFYSTRNRVSMGLLIFVVVVGLPIFGVPKLRQRLSSRVMALKTAYAGEIKPATLQVGTNHEPFPEEFARPIPPTPRAPEIPNLNRVFTMNRRPASPVPAPEAAQATIPKRRLKSEPAAAPEPAAAEQGTSTSPAQTASSGESELKYQRGKAEQEAYDLLVKLKPGVSDLVQGKDPALKFKSWDAANRGEDTYWVRLRFQSEGNADAEYIWQVKVQANQATPLNYNARSLQ